MGQYNIKTRLALSHTRHGVVSLPALALALCLGGCQAPNETAASDVKFDTGTPIQGTPQPRSAAASQSAAPVKPAAQPARAARSEKTAATAHAAAQPAHSATQTTAATRAAPSAEPPIRFVKKFYARQIKTYDKPYGTPQQPVNTDSLPRSAMGTAGGSGVPVYEIRDSYARIALAEGGSGWVTIADVQLTAPPCALVDSTLPKATGPVSAGSSSDSCE